MTRTNDSESLAPRTVAVAILTFRRPHDLGRCLAETTAALDKASGSPSSSQFAIDEIMVIDNDSGRTGESAVAELSAKLDWPIRYICETEPGVANARNRALRECGADVLVFIDDDEVPGQDWPYGLLTAMADSGAALVGGPVDTIFSDRPPGWIEDGKFFARENPAHLATQEWLRSGNLAIDVGQVRSASLWFDPRMTVSEDVAFSRQARSAGLDLRWSRNGSVSEYVGADRFSVAWRLRREYRAQQGWSTVTLNLGDQSHPTIRTVTRGFLLMATGIGKLARSLVPPSKATAVHGLAQIWGGAGRLSGWRQS